MRTVTVDLGSGTKEIDIKNYAKVEKIPGGTIEDCRVLKGECLEAQGSEGQRQRRGHTSRSLMVQAVAYGVAAEVTTKMSPEWIGLQFEARPCGSHRSKGVTNGTKQVATLPGML